MLALVLVLGAGLFAGELAIVSHAESAAKVTASSAKIRKSADSSSEVIGSATKDKTISIKSQTKGADGYTWYEVYVDVADGIHAVVGQQRVERKLEKAVERASSGVDG